MEPTGPNLAEIFRQSRPATERRHTMRHRAHSPAYARLNAAHTDAPDLSEILDISEDGMSIQTSSPLQVERNLTLWLDFSETGASIRTTGQVVWSESSGRAGIRFAKISGQSLDQLKEWLFVNILTAFDHAGSTSPNRDGSNSASKGPPPSHTMPEVGSISRPAVVPGNGGPTAQEERPRAGGITTDSVTRDGVTRERASEKATKRESEVEAKGLDRETTLLSIAERALTLTGASGAAIALSEGNDSEMACVASAGSDAPPVGSRLQVGSGFSGECVRTGRSLRCDDSETDNRVDREGCRVLGIRSLVAVPIRLGNKVVGLLEVFSPQAYAFNADDISALQQLTGSVVSTIGSRTDAQPADAHRKESQASRSIPAPPPPQAVQVPQIEKQPAAKTPHVDAERPVAATKVTSPPHSAQPRSAPAAPAQSTLVQPLSTQTTSPKLKSAQPRSNQASLPKVLFVAAIGTFVFALLWLIAPWVSSAMRSSAIRSTGRTNSQAQLLPAAIPKSPSLPPSVNDLASLRKVAEQGDPAAQFALGARYATGEEVKQDYTEAVRWFTRAAEQGHILAQATLGAYYWAGRGVPQDLTKAYYWSVLAQAGGDQASKYRVAVLASRMSRSQVLAAQQQANDWLSNFASHPPSTP
jgi:hypothetical protein